MTDKIKNIVVTISFLFIIIIVFIINIIKKDTTISISERRKLQQFPKFSISSLLNGNFFKEFENYTMDQFDKREELRKLKINIEVGVLKKQDYNNIYKYDNKLIEQIYPLNEKSVNRLISKIDELYKMYLTKDNNIYYTIIPDKNYFVNENNLKLDYNKLEEMMNRNLMYAQYINIFDCLDLSSYYTTDSHWKQEKLKNVVDKIAYCMDLNLSNKYKEKTITSFKGVYAGQFPVKIEDDEIKVLTNDLIDACSVYNYETKAYTQMYDMKKINSYDKYDIYLSGAVSLLSIENPMNNSKRELIIFRDSYSSSLIPLLVEAYSKITVIDTRYISPKILNKYVNFEGKDILFAYSTTLINNSVSLK